LGKNIEMKLRPILMLAVSAIALWAAFAWGFAIFHWPFSVLSGTDESSAQIIMRVMPHHIIDPQTFNADSGLDFIMEWLFVETKTRLVIIALMSFALLTVVWRCTKRDAKVCWNRPSARLSRN
jgi:hypothetical protein